MPIPALAGVHAPSRPMSAFPEAEATEPTSCAEEKLAERRMAASAMRVMPRVMSVPRFDPNGADLTIILESFFVRQVECTDPGGDKREVSVDVLAECHPRPVFVVVAGTVLDRR